MARRLVSDDQQIFRVVIVSRQRRDNLQWQRGVIGPDNPRFLWDGPEYTTAYGPYNTIGAARGQLTFHTVDSYGNPKNGVVSGHIEQAHTVWAPVGEQADPIAAARAQAYRDAAAEINALPQDYECDPGRGDAAEFLRRRADEIHPAVEETDQ